MTPRPTYTSTVYLCIGGDRQMSPDKFLKSAIYDPSGAGRVKAMCKQGHGQCRAGQGRTRRGGGRGWGESVEQEDVSSHAAAGGPGWWWESLMDSGCLPNNRRRSGPGHATGA